ncbi:metalloprotease [Psychroflexus salis]|nr:metalloprotease [Psychroflexus salis]
MPSKFLFNLFIPAFLFLNCERLCAQQKIDAQVSLNKDLRSFSITQKVIFKNTSTNTLKSIWLYDWVNAFSNKRSALGKRYAQEYIRKFHFASDEDRGGTDLEFIKNNSQNLKWSRPKDKIDLIEVDLPKALQPGEEVELQLSYSVVIPLDKFTGFGFNNGNFRMKYWLIQPAVYQNEWWIYSDLELFDQPQQPADYHLELNLPKNYNVNTALTKTLLKEDELTKSYLLTGKNHSQIDLHLELVNSFTTTVTDFGTLISNIKENQLNENIEALIIDRILNFLSVRLDKFPNERILVSEKDYDLSPVYGLNQLPDFIRPFPDGFQFDIKLFKTLTDQYLKYSIFINSRKDQWILDAIQYSLMMEYVDIFYPDTKLLGTLSNIKGISWTHASSLDFNDQYDFLLQTMIRQNIDQTLVTPQDSLLRFNKKIANPYKAGIAMDYLKDYSSKNEVNQGIKEFYVTNKSKFTSLENFKSSLNKNTKKDIDWWFNDFASTNQFIDFKIQQVKRNKNKDSLEVKIVNRYPNQLPVAISQLKNNKEIHKTWVEGFGKDTVIRLKNEGAERLAINYNGKIPELNKRNNYQRVSKLFSKPLQLRLLEDIEDPSKEQLFVIPEFGYNLYDGFYAGPKLYNTSLLPKQFSYALSPKYGLVSNALVGSASMDYTFMFKDDEIFSIRTGIGGSRFSYDVDLFFNSYSAYASFFYRPKNLRSNVRQSLSVRTSSVNRDESELTTFNEPEYDIYNVNYRYQNKNLDRFFTANVDYQISKKFSKVSATSTFRKLFINNRQINFRFYGGLFLFNDTDSDFFSFALDRPTDYLFDYNYYGRSEESGLFSQQFIMAEGGFKSMLQPAFANEWIATTNVSTTIWNWIFAYGDMGFVKNRGADAEFLYDSGIRLNLVEDYFEMYFPAYSSLGWEVGQPNYAERIRFIVTLDIPTLFRLFTRKWY